MFFKLNSLHERGQKLMCIKEKKQRINFAKSQSLVSLSIVICAVLIILTSGNALAKGSNYYGGSVHVNGHVTRRGTYVAPHFRTAPDFSRLNNWSNRNNTNPYTGKRGYK